jgi:hypothetical protein
MSTPVVLNDVHMVLDMTAWLATFLTLLHNKTAMSSGGITRYITCKDGNIVLASVSILQSHISAFYL